jgi:hypothetical protein
MTKTITIYSIFGVLLFQVICGWIFYHSFPSWEERGQFGDMFGVVNATFSGLAFAGAIYAVLLQQEALALQREELKATREELKNSIAEQKRQAEAMAKSTQLDTVNFLLSYYKATRGDHTISGKPDELSVREIDERINTLIQIISGFYADIEKEFDQS